VASDEWCGVRARQNPLPTAYRLPPTAYCFGERLVGSGFAEACSWRVGFRSAGGFLSVRARLTPRHWPRPPRWPAAWPILRARPEVRVWQRVLGAERKSLNELMMLALSAFAPTLMADFKRPDALSRNAFVPERARECFWRALAGGPPRPIRDAELGKRRPSTYFYAARCRSVHRGSQFLLRLFPHRRSPAQLLPLSRETS
jgi:hypothetical protein